MEKEELLQAAKDYLKTKAGKKLAGLGTDVENLKKQKDDIKEQLDPEQLKNRLKQYIPVLEKFKVKGRLYDKFGNAPLEKAKVTPLLALGKPVTTDDKGQFTIELEIPILPANGKALVQTQLLVTKKKFIPTNLEVLTGSRIVKTDVKTKSLIDIEKAAEAAIQEYKNFVDGKIIEAQGIALSLFEKVIFVRKAAIYKLMNSLIFKLLPLAIQLLLIFGITKPEDAKKAVCPTPEQLKRVVKTRNKITRQLNQIYKSIALNTALAVIFTIIATKLKEINISLTAVPSGFGFPLLTVQKVRELLDKLIDENKNMNIQLLIAILFLVAALIILSRIFKIIDSLILKCGGGNEVELVELNAELRALAEDNKENGVDSPNQVNGFILEVQSLDQNAVGNLKRRQAVGKDSKGVVIVKGEPSFSADDTVLINELAFYIQSKDLKAY